MNKASMMKLKKEKANKPTEGDKHRRNGIEVGKKGKWISYSRGKNVKMFGRPFRFRQHWGTGHRDSENTFELDE